MSRLFTKEGEGRRRRPIKKLGKANCQDKSNTKFNAADWHNHLHFVTSFFSTYKVAAVRDVIVKPVGDDRPFLSVDIFGQRFSGLLDSGSAISIVGSELFEHFSQIGVKLQGCNDLSHITTANNSEAKIEGCLFLPVEFDGSTKVIRFYVVPDISTSLIFGVDFWKSFNLAPDIFGEFTYSHDSPRNSVAQISCLHPLDRLNLSQRAVVNDVIRQFEEIFFEKKGLGRTHLLCHNIDTGNSPPLKQRYYPLSPERLEVLNKQVDDMLVQDVIEKSDSAWNNPTLFAPKSNGELRFCIDSRKLNAVSKHDAYPLPYISSILDSLRDAKFLSSIDLKSAFWQVLLSPSSREKTAFTVPGRGLFQFKVMCFGLTGAPATQQRLMDTLFGPEFNGKVFVYLDDIVIVSSTFEEHISLLFRVLERLKYAKLTINLSKSQFFRKELKYLGYVVDEMGLRTDPSKISSMVEFPTPTSRKEVKRFLGTASYYRRFINNFSSIAAPLNVLTTTSKNAPPFEWTEEAEKSFNDLKSALVSAPVLACPDFSKQFSVHCDASSYGIAGALTQVLDDGHEHPVAFASRSLNRAERNYSATEREALAVVFSVEHFRPYLEGGPQFKVVTDHSSLKWFFNLSNPTGRLARWGCRLSPYDFIVEHRKGKDNVVPDALSRVVPKVCEINSVITDSWYKKLLAKCTQFPKSCPNYIVNDCKLYRYSKNKFGFNNDFVWREVVPSEKRLDVLKECHSSDTTIHSGIFKTYKRLSLRYFWPKMYNDVVNFVKQCDTCHAYKFSQSSPAGFMGDSKVCSRPFQTISIDLVGPLPRSRAGYTFIFVVLCCFTKYVMLFPLRRAVGKTIAQRLEEDVFLKHGVPRTVIADNGSQFTGSELKSLFRKYDIPQVHLTPRYCPQVNSVERYNKSVMTAISILVKDDHRCWDGTLAKVQFAMNTAVNETTRFTPFFLVHGREAVASGKVYGTQNDSELDLACASRDSHATRLGGLQDVFDKVGSAIDAAHRKSAIYYNKGRQSVEYQIGDIVWKKTFPLSDASKFFMAKLAPTYDKCRVIGKPSHLVYDLERVTTGKPLGSWHVQHLRSDWSSD